MNWIKRRKMPLVIGAVVALLLVAGVFIPVKTKTFSSQVENKYEFFFNRGVLTVSYSDGGMVYEKDVFLSQSDYNQYSVGDQYDVVIKYGVLLLVPIGYIWTAAIASMLVAPLYMVFGGSKRKTECQTNPKMPWEER